MTNKKAQAAMEFLMTYGWAILVVLIALGALFYLGVFDPSIPSTCTATAPITCTDVLADSTANTITLVLGAVGVQNADLGLTTITSPVSTTCAAPASTGISTAVPTAITTVACATGFNIDKKFSGSAVVTYQLQGSTESHSTTVSFSGKTE